MDLVILAGMPATGKSTLAAAISRELGYPILEKDGIKEALFDTLGFDSYPEKRRLDAAANEVLLRVLEAALKAGASVIVDNNFDSESGEKLRALAERYRPRCLTVFLRGDAQTLYLRYVERDAAHLRHRGHALQEHYPSREGDDLEYTMTREEFDEKFFRRGMDRFFCPGARMEIDTTDPKSVDPGEVARRARALLLGQTEKDR